MSKLAACIAFAASLISAPAAADTIVIHAGRLIADASRPASGPSTITVVDGKISSITPGHAPVPPDARLVDLSAKTVLPGLIDTHVHLMQEPNVEFWRETIDPHEWLTIIGVKNARLTIKAGFTTVRDLGAPTEAILSLRRGTAEGLIDGPRILASGPAVSIVGGHGDISGFRPEVLHAIGYENTCTGPAECAARVRELSRAGADVIKITATGGVLSQQARGLGQHFTDDELKSIVDTATSLGLKVAAHAHSAGGAEAAAKAGVVSIEHGTFMGDKVLTAMKSAGTAFVPTLMAFTGVREGLAKNAFTPVVAEKARMALSELGKAAKRARSMGVPIVFGTDSGVYEHGRNAEEFEMLVDLVGMAPAEALASATTAAAKLIGLENEVGRIAPGYSADIIAVTGDPLQDIRVLKKVDYVMVRGREID